MGGAAGFLLELMLFIGFKSKLNMTTQLGHGNPLHLAYSAQYYKSSAKSYPRMHHAWKLSNREDPSQQSVLLVTKATIIVYKTQKVSDNSSVTSYIISSTFVWKGGSMEPMVPPLDPPLHYTPWWSNHSACSVPTFQPQQYSVVVYVTLSPPFFEGWRLPLLRVDDPRGSPDMKHKAT